MTRTIKASEIKPGMKVQFDLSGWDVKGTVATVDVRPHAVWIYTEKWCEMSLDLDSPVTVLSEPAPPQPEEPVTLCARIVVAGRKIYRWTEDPKEPWPWRGEALNLDPVLWSWGQLCGLGHVTVIPDQGWTVPDDTPEVPERIEEWDTWEDVPEGVVVTTPGLFCHYRKNQGVVEFSDPDNDPDWTEPGVRAMPRGYGPWTRVTDA